MAEIIIPVDPEPLIASPDVDISRRQAFATYATQLIETGHIIKDAVFVTASQISIPGLFTVISNKASRTDGVNAYARQRVKLSAQQDVMRFKK